MLQCPFSSNVPRYECMRFRLGNGNRVDGTMSQCNGPKVGSGIHTALFTLFYREISLGVYKYAKRSIMLIKMAPEVGWGVPVKF